MYHFELPYEECRRRRFERTYYPQHPEGYFDGHVWHAYVKAKKETFERFHDKKIVIVNTAEESFVKIEEKIVKDIEIALYKK
ncbi:unnamed protein product [Rotaria sordida]|uniref:Uncharacterized protein n=1 Tax=Rotaria sordida TaxID=392033 RepID=A0A815FS58_9BILA|nr:unnamed protein product [Rotaria sordida]CAF1587125.1 unnamed protein product [Rotaria sordida]